MLGVACLTCLQVAREGGTEGGSSVRAGHAAQVVDSSPISLTLELSDPRQATLLTGLSFLVCKMWTKIRG